MCTPVSMCFYSGSVAQSIVSDGSIIRVSGASLTGLVFPRAIQTPARFRCRIYFLSKVTFFEFFYPSEKHAFLEDFLRSLGDPLGNALGPPFWEGFGSQN